MTCNHLFEGFNPASRLWVYSPDRMLTAAEQQMAQEKLRAFVQGWAAHGAPLTAQAEIFGPGIVLIAVDEGKTGASGCSIDASVHVVKELESELGVDFFNRLKVWALEDGQWKLFGLSDASELKGKVTFDATIQTLDDLWNKSLVPAEQTWLAARI